MTTIFLVAVSIIVWSLVALKIFSGDKIPKDVGLSLLEKQQDKQIKAQIRLTENMFQRRLIKARDPFQPHQGKRVKQRKNLGKKPTDASMFSIEYVGYMAGENGLLAIVEGQNRMARFVAVGDTVFNVKIVSIKSEKLGVLKGKKPVWVPLRKTGGN